MVLRVNSDIIIVEAAENGVTYSASFQVQGDRVVFVKAWRVVNGVRNEYRFSELPIAVRREILNSVSRRVEE